MSGFVSKFLERIGLPRKKKEAELLEKKSSEQLYRRNLETSKLVLGKEHPETLASVNNLAMLLVRKGDYKSAEQLYRRELNGFCRESRKFGGAHIHLKNCGIDYGGCLQEMGMNDIQVNQRLEAVLKQYGFSAKDLFAN